MLNQDFALKLLVYLFKEWISKSNKSVSVTDDKFRDISRHDLVHQGFKSFPFDVDTTSNILDDFMVWIFSSEIFHLSFEVSFLFLTFFSFYLSLLLINQFSLFSWCLFSFFNLFIIFQNLRKIYIVCKWFRMVSF